MLVPKAAEQTLAYYLDELANGEITAAECLRRIYAGFEMQDIIIEHRENIRYRDDAA